MIEPESIAPIMFATMLALIFSGYPVAFCLGGTAVIFAAIGVNLEFFGWGKVSAVFPRICGIMENQTLLAVPYFVFMGTMLEKSRLAEDLLHTVGQVFGPIRGGLALAVVVVGALLAAATGVVGASVVAMGLISLPVMMRYEYNPRFATGVIVASGTLGQIIPPSVVLVVLADQIGTSVGDLFVRAFIPGFLLAFLFALYVVWHALRHPQDAPALPASERQLSGGQLFRRVVLVLIPPLALIVVVLGSIFAGIATPTEAGALGATGAMALAAVSRRITWQRVWDTMTSTTRLTCMVMFLLIGSSAFTLVFRLYGGDDWITEVFRALPGGVLGALILSNVAIFVLGFFIDFFEICFIVIPLLAPVLIGEFGVPPAWFGVMIALNLQTSFLTPPFGFALFYLKGVCPPEIETTQIYRGVVPFIVMQLVLLVGVVVYIYSQMSA